MARTRIQTFRSTTKNVRPAPADTPLEGELYVNQADKQFGMVLPGATTNLDLIAVRFYATTTDYIIGDYVINSGQLYRAKAAVTAGGFDPTKWDAVAGGSGGSGGAAIVVADTAPGSPADNTLWWDSDGGGFFVRFNNSGAPVWAQINYTPPIAAATTATRPTLVAGEAGRSLFDTTLGKPIWWNGTVWKDATGATV